MTLWGRCTAVAVACTMLGAGVVAGAPAATADSRCDSRSHTHGALFWQRTDNFMHRDQVYVPEINRYRWYYLHTSSAIRWC